MKLTVPYKRVKSVLFKNSKDDSRKEREKIVTARLATVHISHFGTTSDKTTWRKFRAPSDRNTTEEQTIGQTVTKDADILHTIEVLTSPSSSSAI